MRRQFIIRARFIVAVIALIAVVIVARLYYLQIIHGESFRAEANSQYVRSSRDIFDRGSIYFTTRDGEHIAAATLKSGYMLAIEPSELEDIQQTYAVLSRHIELDRDDFIARASRVEDPYEEIARHIDPETATAIEHEDLTGVQLFREQWRYYPGDALASHALGYVGFGEQGTVLSGQYGLERYWESALDRQRDRLYVNFFAEIFANVEDIAEEGEYQRAGSVITSIEPSVQQALEEVLESVQLEWRAKEIGGIIMHPATGAIYAMSARPTFDPNEYGNVEDARVFRNPFVEDVYEMGSIIKPIAMAIGLDEGAVTANSTYDDTGSIELDTFTISNYDGRARGVVDMQEVLNQSLNLGMAFVAGEVGGEVLGERMRAFGFGEETGIDLPFEVRGLIENLGSPREVEYVTAAFGQGIALTPIATARALAALGNGGYLTTPHFVTELDYQNGTRANVAPEDRVQVLQPATSQEITRMLVEVVDSSLRNGTVKKDRYSIAAKTGTAQIAKTGERGYYDDRYLHSFFGYFPAYEPEFLIFLYHMEPQGARYASETLTSPFMELVDFLINYYEVPPDR
jgi:cell division protein FtsI/penicillin-binding protein 2